LFGLLISPNISICFDANVDFAHDVPADVHAFSNSQDFEGTFT
jgi:hypothetical protein